MRWYASASTERAQAFAKELVACDPDAIIAFVVVARRPSAIHLSCTQQPGIDTINSNGA